MPELLGTLAAIALLDSINPNAMAVQIYLLSTPRPIPRSIAFIFGDFLAAWISGMLIALGLMQLVTNLFDRLGDLLYVLQFIIGVVLIILGWNIGKLMQQSKVKRPKSLKPTATFFFGLTMALVEAPTALPFLVAIERITQTNPTLPKLALLLLFYVLIFIFPLVVLVSVYYFTQNRASRILANIQAFVNRWFPILFRFVLIVFGIILILDSIAHQFGRSLI
jgi:cytochrome c biogenesis protein CcdA